MRTRARRALALLLPASVVAGVRYGVLEQASGAGAHSCERVELFFPVSTLVHGTTGCVPHDAGTHLCTSTTIPSTFVVTICRG